MRYSFVFVLCPGRCGSATFIAACKHITNYSAGHESRSCHLGPDRLAYPDHHIEADNRLSWFLGKLDERFGKDPCYVFLRRSEEDVAKSYSRRWSRGIIRAYREDVLTNVSMRHTEFDVCLDYVRTVHANIRLFLKDKPHQMTVELEHVKEQFPQFWEAIEATGDLEAAGREWDIRYNRTKKSTGV